MIQALPNGANRIGMTLEQYNALQKDQSNQQFKPSPSGKWPVFDAYPLVVRQAAEKKAKDAVRKKHFIEGAFLIVVGFAVFNMIKK